MNVGQEADRELEGDTTWGTIAYNWGILLH